MPTTEDARVSLALQALAEVTDPGDIGPLEEVLQPEPGVVDLLFACTLEGYPEWRWTVSTSALDGVAPTVLEVELVPGDGALLAPPWVPWTERLAEWRRAHAEGADGAAEAVDDEDDLEDEADDEDLLDPDDDVDEELGDDVDDADDDRDEADDDDEDDLDDDDPDEDLDEVDEDPRR